MQEEKAPETVCAVSALQEAMKQGQATFFVCS